MTFSVEQAGGSPGSPYGSEEHTAFLDALDGVDEVAEETPATTPDEADGGEAEKDEEIVEDEDVEEEVEEPEEETEEEVHPLVQAQLDKLAKMEKDLAEQKAGMDKYFTEQAEHFKKLREEAGVEELHKSTKTAKKELKGYGFKDDGTYIPRNYADGTSEKPGMLSDKILDHAVKSGTITQQQASIARTLRPVMNAALNEQRRELLEQLRAEIDSVHESYKPIKETATEASETEARQIVWRGAYGDFAAKYKPTDEQRAALETEIYQNMALIDTMTPEQTEIWMRRVIHDPELLRKTATMKPKKPKPKKEEEVPKTRTEKKRDSYEELLSSMYD